MVKDPCNTMFLIWDIVKDLCSWIFYRQVLKILEHRGWEYPYLEQLYKYLWISCRVWWVMPWTGLLAWYIILVRGCRSATTKCLIQDTCHKPSFNSKEEVPWFLDLWSPRAANDRPPLGPFSIISRGFKSGPSLRLFKPLNETATFDDEQSERPFRNSQIRSTQKRADTD